MTPKAVASTKTLTIDEELKFITVENEMQLFLRFDNDDKNGNRILKFFSATSMEMMRDSTEWHVDGTFPAIFYQMVTIQCVIQTQIIHAAYALVENKNKATYTAMITAIKSICHENGENQCLRISNQHYKMHLHSLSTTSA
jgi:hypothetical protein